MTVCLVPVGSSSEPWSLATVYGPVEENLKLEFLNELREIHVDCDGPLLIHGDFNLIYQATDKSNDRLNLRSMHRFRRALDDMQVDELYLHVRLYTWSNERQRPTMEHIDRAFALFHGLKRTQITTSGRCRPTARITLHCYCSYSRTLGLS